MEHASADRGIKALLAPRSIAIIGASGDPSKIGAMPLRFLRKYGYAGRVYPVNPGYQDIDGLRCYPSISSIDDVVDLMVVTVPNSRVPALLDECEPGRVTTALVLSSGYAEVGDAGMRRQEALVNEAKQRGIRLCGPNSVGSVNLWNAVVPSISQAFDTILEPGPIAFVAQSGALGTAVLALAQAAGLRLGYFINTGNEADLSFTDFCDYLIDDPGTRIIAGYVEGLRDGRRFAACARRAIERGKAIVLLKVGRSQVGAEAARSHTGAIAGSDMLYDAVFDACGVTRVDSIEALVDTLRVFSALPAPSGRSIALVTHSGGTGVLMSDACVQEGLEVTEASVDLQNALRPRLPDFASLRNPIDMTAGVIFKPDVMVGCLEQALTDEHYHAGVLSVNLMWRVREALAAELIALRQRTHKPFAVAWIGIAEATAQQLQQANVPAFSDPTRCIKSLAALARWSVARQRQSLTGSSATEAPAVPRKPVPETFTEQAQLLTDAGISLAPWRLAPSSEAAAAAAQSIGYPVVAKVICERFSHKSDAGGVAINLRTPGELEGAVARFERLTQGEWGSGGILVQPMVTGGLEVLVGAQRDPVFGPYVVVSLGGIYVETLGRPVVALAPLSEREATALIESASWSPLLLGARGQRKRDLAALARLIHCVSLLVSRYAVGSMDLNPVMVMPEGQGVVAVDFRLIRAEDAGAAA